MVAVQEVEQAIQDLEQKIGKIRDKVAEIDDQIKNTSVKEVERIEAELEQLKNRYYEIQARELIGGVAGLACSRPRIVTPGHPKVSFHGPRCLRSDGGGPW